MNTNKQQLDFVYRQQLLGQVASLVCAAFIVYLLWGKLETLWLPGWFSTLAGLSVLRLIVGHFYFKPTTTEASCRFFGLFYIAGTLLSGLVWAASVLFLNLITEPVLQFGMVIIFAGITSGSIISNALVLPGYYAFQVPVLGSLSIWMLTQQTPTHTSLAIIVLFYAAMLSILAKKFHDNVITTYRTKDALQKSEQRFRNIVEAAPDAMIIVNDAGEIIMANEEAVNLFGYSKQELLGNKIEMLIPPRFNAHEEARQEYTQNADVGSVRLNPALYALHKNGKEIPVEIRLNPVPFEDGRYTSSSIRDISTHLEIENELRHARNQAEQASKAKTDFISNINHELRTPLNAVIGFTDLMKLADNLTTEQKDQLSEIYSAGKHLVKLINDLQDITRIETGHIELSPEDITVIDVLQNCISLTQPLANKHNIKVELLEPDDEKICIHADKTRFKQIIINLLTNAIKYNSENGAVTLHYQQLDNNLLKVSITDTGPGLTTEQLRYLYTPHNRLGAEDSEVEGSGIGLALSKSLLEQMGGKIELETRYGFGSTFSVVLPLARAQHVPQYQSNHS